MQHQSEALVAMLTNVQIGHPVLCIAPCTEYPGCHLSAHLLLATRCCCSSLQLSLPNLSTSAAGTALTCCFFVEVYGRGKSEKLLGEFQKTTGTNVKVATKFAPLPWRFGQNAPVKALKVNQCIFMLCNSSISSSHV